MTEPLSYRAPPPYPSVLRFKHATDREATITCATVGSLEVLPRAGLDPILRCYVSTPGSDIPLAGKYNAELSDIVITCGGDGNHDCRMNRIRERPGAPPNLVVTVDCARAASRPPPPPPPPDMPMDIDAPSAAAGRAPRGIMVDPQGGIQAERVACPAPIPPPSLVCLQPVPLFQPEPIYIFPHGPSGL
jgi:hypothetical protein